MIPRPRLFVPSCLLLALTACAGHQDGADAPVIAAVTTQPAQPGSLPEIVTAYGSIMPAPDATTTLAVQSPGYVAHLDVAAGSAVKRGQRLLTFTLAPAAVAAYRQAQTALDVARSQHIHTTQLLAQQLATRDQLNLADKAVSDAQAALDALRRQQGARATLELDAPYDGTVSSLTAVQGDVLQSGAPLLTLARRDGLVASVGIEPQARSRVKPGDRVTLVPLDGGQTMPGEVRRVTAALDARTHLIDVDITPEGEPIDGAGFRADIVVGQWQGWLLPRDALIGDGSHWHVFQVADGKAVQVPVDVLGESDALSVVTGALDAKRPVVTVGGAQLEEGMAVRAHTAGTAP